MQNQTRDYISLSQIKQIVYGCLNELFDKDLILLQNDVSERAITHKLAEYLQERFPYLNVDCEYNRNIELGELASKKLKILKDSRQTSIKNDLGEDDLLAISTYPDIIIHRRLTNDDNLLIIEIKKRNSRVDHDHDFGKLKAFTDCSDRNSYNYKYGVFILLDTGNETPKGPNLTWFVDGEDVTTSKMRNPAVK